MTVTQPPATWVSGILLAAFLTAASAAAARAAPTGARKLNPAEQWVLEQVTAGELADLAAAVNADQTKKFPEESERVLGARFVQDIITGRLPGVKPFLRGVLIRGAMIEEELDL